MGQEEQITKISLDLLIPNANQPRKVFSNESIQELAISIKEYGILNPILVRKKDNLYEIIAGERRYRAAKLLNLKEVPVIIKNVNDNQLTAIALIENLQRENISPIEEAKSYQEILKLSNLKEQELSNLIGKSQPYISNKLRLLKLPQNIQEALINKKISERHARTLISIDDPNRQNELLNRIIDEKLSVKELEKIINEKEITDEEIKSAIDDIMKTLNFNLDDEKEEKKEEKESENMNNENTTLNSMNMQTLNQGPAPSSAQTPVQPFVYNQPTPEPTAPITPEVAPTPEPAPLPAAEVPNPIPDFNIPAAPVAPETAPTPEPTPLPTLEVPNPIPDFNIPAAPATPEITPTPEPAPLSTFELPNPIPDFNITTAPVTPEVTPNVAPVVPEVAQMPETPLFDPNIQMTPTPVPTPEVPTQPSFEVPVVDTVSETPNKLVEVENYLTNNGINYKKYSNETGNCIIIEL